MKPEKYTVELPLTDDQVGLSRLPRKRIEAGVEAVGTKIDSKERNA